MSTPSSILCSSEEFGKFFSEYRTHFVRIAFSYVRDRDAANDIVTDCFVYLWERRAELTSETNLKGYLYCCMRNRCNSFLRAKLTHLKAHDELSKEAQWQIRSGLESLSGDDISDKLFHKELVALFRAELERMPARTRAVFLASREEGMTYQQIAERFDMPLRRVTGEMQSALQHLRISLKDYLPLLLLLLFARE
ncbi:RNA polymerase sigma-70 factor [uncultured Alistipes sp.]|uniref:RNA polymerase sigma-70 factor n=1 Tax=uncultured Alistipes sp. TaxID=538949 RepID=UPI00272A0A1C|nr:RNA polymerase sigma-70 factor [uncultured Alistipes sp.]